MEILKFDIAKVRIQELIYARDYHLVNGFCILVSTSDKNNCLDELYKGSPEHVEILVWYTRKNAQVVTNL